MAGLNRRIIFIIILILFFLPALMTGQSIMTAEVETNFGLVYAGAAEWITTASVFGDLNYSYVSTMTEAKIALGLFADEKKSEFRIDEAWIGMSFGDMRLTGGVTGLDWGVGKVFNAANLINNDEKLNFDLGADEFRVERNLLLAFYFPVEDLLYLEAAALPAASLLLPEYGAITIKPIEEGSAGLRLGVNWDSLTGEVLYLLDGKAQAHKIGMDIKGTFLVDWYLGGRCVIPFELPTDYSFLDTVTASAGLTSKHELSKDFDLSWTVEALCKIGAEWSELKNPNTKYGLTVYPEIALTAYKQTKFYIRELYSVIDTSARFLGGFDWNPTEFWGLSAAVSVDIGESTDVFCNDRLNGMAMTFGMNLQF